jgi:CubicO group peptidase (beta-lactamase class C family)
MNPDSRPASSRDAKPLLAALFIAFIATNAAADPREHWLPADPAAAGTADSIKAVQDYAATFKPTALMIIRDGRLMASSGDPGQKVDVASVRKSLLGALYGIAVSEGRIDLGSTLAQLGIDDNPPDLTHAEKQATVRDLLAARSGVYHLAAHETAEMDRKRPARGSHAPGSFWFYNNWDFNTLGAIYRQATGEDIFASFERRIARPIGMEDFTIRDGRYAAWPSSLYPAYPFSMTARDLARFGLLFLNQGSWQGQQIVPASWIRDSTTSYSQTDRGNRGYGYLWWTLATDEWGPGAALASGFGGQFIAIIPAKRLIVVQTIGKGRDIPPPRSSDFFGLLRKVTAAAP